jgi:DNA polymerase III gamma/tau subunit
VDDASDAGTDMQVLIRSLIGEFRNLLVARIDPELLSRDLAPEDAQTAAARSKQLTQAHIVRALRLLSDALATARSSGNPRLELETALLRYTLAVEDTTLDALASRVAALEEGGAAVAAPSPRHGDPSTSSGLRQVEPPPSAAEAKPPRNAAEASPQPVTIQKVRAAWQSIRTKVESERASLRTQLSRAVPDSIEGNAVIIKLPNQPLADTLKDHAKLVESAMAEVLGTRLKASFKVDGAAARSKGGSAAPTAATVQDEDPDELLSYLNERIK